MTARQIQTRFRAYQLGEEGSSFSYFADGHFTLIEARLTDLSTQTLGTELKICGRTTIDTLHITSWDNDHCDLDELSEILTKLTPRKIEYPGYDPHTETGENCLAAILKYVADSRAARKPIARSITPAYIASLKDAEALAYDDILYHPKAGYEGSNNNSTVKLFRCGSFNVASLGDVEDARIGAFLRRNTAFKSEVDVLILPHHGGRSDVMTREFLNRVRPSLAICSSNYDNQFDHPTPELRNLLHEEGVPIYTTKTGDVVLYSRGTNSGDYRVENLKADSTELSSWKDFVAKKRGLLGVNRDTLRDRYMATNRGPRR